MDEEKKILEEKKKILLSAFGKVIKRERNKINKGINKFSFEYDIGNGLLSRIESGRTDAKITTLFKLANAFQISFSELAILIEKELPKNFNFYD